MNDLIIKEHTFSHPIDKVWSAISKGEELSTWFIKADFKAEPGYRYTFTASEAQNCTQITGMVKKASPYTLIYTWVVENTTTETTVKWVLEKVEDGTKLYLEHSGIAGYPGDNAVAMFKDFSNGWGHCINGLSEYLTQEVHAG